MISIPRSWMMTQEWHDLLFIHSPICANTLRQFVPPILELDLYNQTAWMTIIPFSVSAFRPRFLPPLPFIHNFLEVNVRTYVTYNGVSGVYFFSLDANSLLAVFGARTFFHLPYFYANMSMKKEGNIIEYKSARKNGGGELHVQFEPKEKIDHQTNLDRWLTERYVLFTTHNEDVYVGKIKHKQWDLFEVNVKIKKQSLLSPFLDELRSEDLIFHYAPFKKAFFSPIKRWD